ALRIGSAGGGARRRGRDGRREPAGNVLGGGHHARNRQVCPLCAESPRPVPGGGFPRAPRPAPVPRARLWMAGAGKIDFRTLMPYEGTVHWFGSIGIPFPAVGAFLAGWTEVLGAVLLVLGLATRLIFIPLMVTMLVAAFA